MLSLGYFYQQKKLSLQAQEAEAHGAFLRIIDLMRSVKAVDQIEAINLCGQICSRFASPTIVNSAFMRMAEAFRTGSNTLQLEILRIVQKNIQHLPKIRNHSEFIRPIFTVIYSNDPVARAITLRLLAAIAVSIPNQLDVHHAVRVALQSKDRNELQAALFACRSLAKISSKFAEEIAADIVVLVDKPELSDDERIAALQIIPYIAGMRLDTRMVSGVVSKILDDGKRAQYQSSSVVETCLHTISDLLTRGADSDALKEHLLTLISYVYRPEPEVSRPASVELLRFFRLCASQLESLALSEVLLCLLASDNEHVVSQGIKCAYFFVNDPLTCNGLDTLDQRIIQQITNHAFRQRMVSGTCAFAVLCKVLALTCTKSSGENLSKFVQECCESISQLTEIIQAVMEEKKDSKEKVTMLKFMLLGLNSHNLRRFPPELRHHCLGQTSKFSFPGPTFQLLYLKHLRDLVAVNAEEVRNLLDRSVWTSTVSACSAEMLYRLLFHVVALRFQLSDSVGPVVQEGGLADDVLSFDLTHWDVYRLARTSLADGRHVFSMKLIQFMLTHSYSGPTSSWLQILLTLARTEVAKMELQSPGFSVTDRTEAIQKIGLGQMDTLLQLSYFCGSNRLGIFRKNLLDLRASVQQSLLLLVNTIEKIRLRAADMKESAGVQNFAFSQLVGPLTRLKDNAEESVRLYQLTFDSDGPSQLIVRFYYDICVSLGQTIAAATNRPFLVTDNVSPSSARLRGSEETFSRLERIPPTITDNDSATALYAWLKELFQIATFFLTFPVPIPRYFLQQYQQTTLAVALTPAPSTDKDYVQTITMDTRFTLKLDGVLSAERLTGRILMRKVKAVRVQLKVVLIKSLPFSSKALANTETASEGMVEDIHLDGLSFFSHTFVVNLGYPGVYRIDLEFQLHDENAVAWKAMPTVSLTVRVLESFGMQRKGAGI